MIGDSSRNANGSQCFKYQGYDHVAQYPTRNFLVKEVDVDEIEIVIYKPTGNVTDSNDNVRVFSIQLGVIRCVYEHNC